MSLSDSQEMHSVVCFWKHSIKECKKSVWKPHLMLDGNCAAHRRDFYMETERSIVAFVAISMKI